MCHGVRVRERGRGGGRRERKREEREKGRRRVLRLRGVSRLAEYYKLHK